MARNRVIGANNALPWHLSSDLKRFKALTMGHHIIMGRKTFESIGRILPGRTSVVVSRNPDFRFEGALVAENLSKALALAADDSEAFIIGGGEIYAHALPLADRIYMTEVHATPAGDARFPEIRASDWTEASREPVRSAGTQDTDFDFVILDRKNRG